MASKTASLRFPLIVKPDSQGSSLGLGIAPHRRRVAVGRPSGTGARYVRDCRAVYRRARIHRGNPWPPAFAAVGIVAPAGLFDYEAKYESAMTEYRFDMGLLPETAAEIEHAAVAAADAPRYSRVGAR